MFGAARWESIHMFGITAATGRYERRAARRPATWTKDYLREVALADLGCAVVGVLVAAQLRFGYHVRWTYLALSLSLPVLWIVALWLAGAYDVRFIGTGSDEFRKVLNASVTLTATVAIFSYAINLELSRVYIVIALPSLTLFDMVARLGMRKRLHKKRASGKCMHSVVAVGHEPAVADLVTELGRDRYHGLTVVGACVAWPGERDEVAGVQVYGGLDDITAAVKAFDTLGPRPALPDEAEKYADHVRRRLVVKPGLTGLWEVNGRSDLSWEESVRLDLRYVENWSFALDLQILWKTISVLFHGSGAY